MYALINHKKGTTLKTIKGWVLMLLGVSIAWSGTSFAKVTMSNFRSTDAFNDLAGSELNDVYLNQSEVVLDSAYQSDIYLYQNRQGLEGNRAKVNLTNTYGSTVGVNQWGASNIALVEQSNGTGNIAVLNQFGEGHHGLITQNGDRNQAYLVQDCMNAMVVCRSSKVSIDQDGVGNIAYVQDNVGVNQHIEQSGAASGIILIHGLSNRGIHINQ